MTSATASRGTSCSSGIARELTSLRSFRCCRPCSATSTRAPPTGTWKPCPSCWPSPRVGPRRHWRFYDDPVRPTARGLLHRPSDPPKRCEPAHHRLLPRRLLPPPPIRQRRDRQGSLEARTRRPRCIGDRGLPRSPPAEPAQQRREAKHPARGVAVLLLLRGVVVPRARQPDQPCPRHSAQT